MFNIILETKLLRTTLKLIIIENLMSAISITTKYRKVLVFLGLTFGLNWGLAITYFSLGNNLNSKLFLPMALIYMLIPATVAVLVQKFIYKLPVKRPLGISLILNRWFAVAWILPFILAIFNILTDSLMTTSRLQPSLFHLGMAIFNLLTINTFFTSFFTFGEELGWRGMLLAELKNLSFFKANLIIGVIWGIWHAPLILAGYNYPQHPKIGLLLFVFQCILLSNIFSYLRLKAKSVIASSIVHAAYNASASLVYMFIGNVNDLIVGVCGICGISVLLIVNILIYLFDKNLNTLMLDC